MSPTHWSITENYRAAVSQSIWKALRQWLTVGGAYWNERLAVNKLYLSHNSFTKQDFFRIKLDMKCSIKGLYHRKYVENLHQGSTCIRLWNIWHKIGIFSAFKHLRWVTIKQVSSCWLWPLKDGDAVDLPGAGGRGICLLICYKPTWAKTPDFKKCTLEESYTSRTSSKK